MKNKAEAKAKFLELMDEDGDIKCRETITHNNRTSTAKSAWHFGKVEMYQLLDYIYGED